MFSFNRYLYVFASLILTFYTPFSVGQNDVLDDLNESDWRVGGHAKYQLVYTRIPGDSVFNPVSGNSLTDHYVESRLKVAANQRAWRFDSHAQLLAVHSDTLAGLDPLPFPVPGSQLINDKRRWFNLTHALSHDGKNAALIRLDRLSLGYTGEKTVIHFGRQAISWGNGLLFTPMDIFNPFDPTAVDKEYKSGDDMLYGQYLLNNGNDLQLAGVVRRDPVSGEVESEQSSLAIKFHGFLDGGEYDFLAAKHYDDDILGFGFSTDLAEAIFRGDLVWSNTSNGRFFSAVGGVSYSGVIAGHNWSGFIEYFYNGYGQSGGQYSVEGLASDAELIKRLGRGELFNLGKHYVGASATLEVTPLVLFTPNLFINLADPSALIQMVMAYDWKQDLQLLAAFNCPVGPKGSEYGGINSSQPGLLVSTGPSMFIQMAWYF